MHGLVPALCYASMQHPHATSYNHASHGSSQIASEGLNEMRRVDEEYDGENSVLVNVPLDSQIECVISSFSILRVITCTCLDCTCMHCHTNHAAFFHFFHLLAQSL